MFQVQVYVSLSSGEEFSHVHSPAALWVQSVSTSGFEVCARKTGIDANETAILNWFAFQDQPQIMHGRVTFGGIWTTETKCTRETFSKVGGQHYKLFDIFLISSLKFVRFSSRKMVRCHLWPKLLSLKNPTTTFLSL